jgi:integrase
MGNGHPEVRAEPAHVPLPSWLAEDLAVFLTLHPRQTDSPLFPGRRRYPYKPATGPLDWSVPWDRDPFLKNQFRPVLNEAGLPSSVRPHDLRHAFASICAARVIPLSRVSHYLGHSSNCDYRRALYAPLRHRRGRGHDPAAPAGGCGHIRHRGAAPSREQAHHDAVVPTQGDGQHHHA